MNYSLLIIGDNKVDGDGGEVDGDGGDGDGDRWNYGTLSRKLPTPLGFSVLRLLIGEGAMSGVAPGLLTQGWRGQGLGRARPM
jgi:hypothetical protein